MSHEINIVLGILFFTLLACQISKIVGENSISWFCMAEFPETSTHMDLCRY